MAWPKRLIKIYTVAAAILILSVSYLFWLLWLLSGSQFSPESVEIVINQRRIKAEVVSSPIALYRGLSGRTELCRDCGLLFNFSGAEEREFVMRNMKFPLDIIFINAGQIINIARNLAPEGNNPQNIYRSSGPANQVLEINGGYSEYFGFEAGDRVLIQRTDKK